MERYWLVLCYTCNDNAIFDNLDFRWFSIAKFQKICTVVVIFSDFESTLATMSTLWTKNLPFCLLHNQMQFHSLENCWRLTDLQKKLYLWSFGKSHKLTLLLWIHGFNLSIRPLQKGKRAEGVSPNLTDKVNVYKEHDSGLQNTLSWL